MVLMTVALAFGIYAEGMGSMKCGGMKGMDMKQGGCKMMDMSNCPFCVKGADIKVINTADGIQITVVSKDKAVVKEIQEKGKNFPGICSNAGTTPAVMAAGVKESKLDGNPDDKVTCPVTGETFKKKDAFKVYDYKGKKYYMCCGMCVKPFTENPEKYAK
jgi:YHS domain-containing protein